jgi:hypothetical protein
MFRFIFYIILFSSSVQAASWDPNTGTLDPDYYTGSSSGGSPVTENGQIINFGSSSAVCSWWVSSLTDEDHEIRNRDDSYEICLGDLYTRSSTVGNDNFYKSGPTRSFYIDPEFPTPCTFVNTMTNTCVNSFPDDFSEYSCGNRNHNLWTTETHNYCVPPPPCTGAVDCEAFIYDLNGCESFQSQAAADPYIDYTQSPFVYVDDYNFSFTCGTSSSDRIDPITDVAPDPWSDTVDPLISDSGDSGAPLTPTTSSPTTNPVPSGGSPNNSADAETQSIDDSNIVDSIDMLTTMMNGQLNTIESTNNNINNSTIALNKSIDSISSSVNAQTTMLNSQLNSIGDAIVESNNDGAIINAINNTTQTAEDILDLLSADNPISVDPTGLDPFDQQENLDNYQTSFSNSPIMLAMNNIQNVVAFESPYCQPFSIDLSGTILGEVFSTDIHCQLFAEYSYPLTLVMLVIYSFTGFRIFAEA